MHKLEIRTGVDPKKYFPQSEKIITYAFSIGDRHYFRFDDVLNIPYQRGLQTLVFYKELEMNVDRAFLKAHTQAIKNLFTQTQVTIDTLVTIRQLTQQLEDRLELPKEPELMYKLASVVFFDQHESPTNYEFKYGATKIKHWRKNTTLADFFLSKPLVELIPYLRHAGENLEQFSRMIEGEAKGQLESILSHLSPEQRTIFLDKSKSSETPTGA